MASSSSPLNRWLAVLCILLAVLLARDWWLERRAAGEMREIAPRGNLSEEEKTTIELFRQTSPSVVFITSLSVEHVRRDFFNFDIQKIPRGTGSGFMWNDQGHVVTNFHVIQGAGEASVTLSDQSVWTGNVVGVEPDKDLAVLKIDAPQSLLRPLKVGTSADLEVGQKVFAIGNPFGLDHTLTTGVIGGLGREIESITRRPIQGVIQTDAAINPGNSGGPLLDSSGRLIGVNTAIFSPSGANAGIGFAVPVDTVNRIVPQIIRYGRAIKPQLGIVMVEDYTSRSLGVKGVIVSRVQPGSGAAEAGIQGVTIGRRGEAFLGDVIVGIEGEPVTDQNSLFRMLDRHEVGDEVEVTLMRGRKQRTVTVELTASS